MLWKVKSVQMPVLVKRWWMIVIRLLPQTADLSFHLKSIKSLLLLLLSRTTAHSHCSPVTTPLLNFDTLPISVLLEKCHPSSITCLSWNSSVRPESQKITYLKKISFFDTYQFMQILKEMIQSMGEKKSWTGFSLEEINTDIDDTRQELFWVIKGSEINSFFNLLKKLDSYKF